MKRIRFTTTSKGVFQLYLGNQLSPMVVATKHVKEYHRRKHRMGGAELYTNHGIWNTNSLIYFPKTDIKKFIDYEIKELLVAESKLSSKVEVSDLRADFLRRISDTLIDNTSADKLTFVGNTLYVLTFQNPRYINYYDYIDL